MSWDLEKFQDRFRDIRTCNFEIKREDFPYHTQYINIIVVGLPLSSIHIYGIMYFGYCVTKYKILCYCAITTILNYIVSTSITY